MQPLLNLDAGELDTETEALWSLFDILCCACGGHAGDAESMAKVAAFVASRRAHGAQLGAHPSYPDRDHFGRRSIEIDGPTLAASIRSQCAALLEIAGHHGIPVTHAKPHGALYHDANRDRALADLVVDAVVVSLGPEVIIIGPPAGELVDSAHRAGVRYAREGFADRRMRDDGSLVPRSEPNALIVDPSLAAFQAKQLASDMDTICIHGDTPNAIEIARAVRDTLELD
jgi:UPF0271 protein